MRIQRGSRSKGPTGRGSGPRRIARLTATSALCVLFATGLSVAGASATPTRSQSAGSQPGGTLEQYGPAKSLIGAGNSVWVSGVAADSAGNVYMASNTGPVWELPVDGGIPVRLNTPAAAQVAVDAAGDVYSAPAGEGSVSELRAGSTTSVMVPLTGVLAPGALAVDRAGDLFVADDESPKVVELLAGTSTQVTLPFTGLSFADGLAVDSAGDVYVANGNAGDVLELAAGASAQTIVPLTGLDHPNGVAVDSSGNLYVADGDTQVTELNRSSGTQRTLPFTGLGPSSSIAVDGSGDVLVGDLNNYRVLQLTPGGTVAHPLFLDVTPKADIAIDSADDTFVPDFSGDRVVELSAGSNTPTVLPFTGLVSPNAVAVDSAGDVFVSESGPQPIVELPAGSSTQLTLPITASSGADGVAVDGHGDVFAIVDGGSVVELAAGSATATILPFPTTFTLYSSISADTAGDVVVSSYHQLPQTTADLELTAGSNEPTPLPFVGLTYPGSVAMDSSGDVFASGQANSSVYELLDGSGPPYTLPTITGLSDPLGLAVGSSGTLDVANVGPTGIVQQFRGLGPVTAPGAPTGVAAVPGDGQAVVSFTPPASDGGWPITSYTVTGTDDTTPTNPPVTQSVAGGPATFTGLVNGDYYTFSVSAVTALGHGPAGTSRPRAPGTVPAAPSVSTIHATSGVVSLKLSPPTSVANPPILFYTVVATNQTDTYSTGQTVTSVHPKIKVTGLLNGDAYTFSVTASNEVGTSTASPPTAGIVPGAPSAPRAVKAKAVGGQVTVTFKAPSSAGQAPVSSYTVSAVDETDAARGGQTTTGTASPMTVTGLTSGDTYVFTVTATNADGPGMPTMSKPVHV